MVFKRLFVFIFPPIILTVLGEFILKYSINTVSIPISLESVFLLIQTPMVVLGFFCLIIGGVLWLVAMTKFELSFVYPFLSINYIVVMLGSDWLLKETVGFNRYMAIVFIIVGLVLISRSPNAALKGAHGSPRFKN